MQINDGGPAYPIPFNPSWPNDASSGMALRDAFAIAALPMVMQVDEKADVVASMAYAMADAMLRARGQS